MARDISDTCAGMLLVQQTMELLEHEAHYVAELSGLRDRTRAACREGRLDEAMRLIPVVLATERMIERIRGVLAGRGSADPWLKATRRGPVDTS